MKNFHLLQILEPFSKFHSPKCALEQYPTAPEIALDILRQIQGNYENLSSNCLIDLGAGMGCLSVAAILNNVPMVIAIEIDSVTAYKFLAILKDDNFLLNNIEIIIADVSSSFIRSSSTKKHWIALSNPPFGTKSNSGSDIIFLNAASHVAKISFTLHKSSTRNYILRKYPTAQVLTKFMFPIKNFYKFHKFNLMTIEVDLIKTSFY